MKRTVSDTVPAVFPRSLAPVPLVANPVNTVVSNETVVLVRPDGVAMLSGGALDESLLTRHKAKSLTRDHRSLRHLIGTSTL